MKPVGYCGTDGTYSWGVANGGSVYGLAYRSCSAFKTFRWNPRAGTRLFPSATTKADGNPSNGRPNRISADGSTVVGWEEPGDGAQRMGVIWLNGKPQAVTDANGQNFAEVYPKWRCALCVPPFLLGEKGVAKGNRGSAIDENWLLATAFRR